MWHCPINRDVVGVEVRAATSTLSWAGVDGVPFSTTGIAFHHAYSGQVAGSNRWPKAE
jgi:hypothetical protein